MKFSRAAESLAILLAVSLSYPLNAADTRGAACTADPSSDLFFVGTLTDLTTANSPPGWSLGTFNISELLRGESPALISMLMRDGLCHDQGTVLSLGRRYLIFTRMLPKSSPRAASQLDHCDQIRPLDQATGALEYLRRSRKGDAPTEVSGEAVVNTNGYPWKRVPLPKTKIHLVGPSQRFEFLSDDEGNFYGAISPGKYAITAEFPTGYEEDYSKYPPMTMTENRCTLVRVSAPPTASITAHVADTDGDAIGPMSNVQLSLETAEAQQFVQSVWPDENNNLKANNLLPGEYILGLNTYLPVNRGSAPYPPIYYPGVRARSEAQVITLRSGEQKILAEMRIKKGQQCEIPVLVIDSLGKPSPATAVALAYRDYPNFYIEPREQTDENGTGRVYAVFPGPVFLKAVKQRNDGSRVESERLEVGSCPTETISLKLSLLVVDQSEPKKN